MVWRPFLLNPDMPRAGMARSDYMIRKFGAEERGRRLYNSITELGAAEGIEFNFAAIRRTPSSVDAHRLIRYAQSFGAADILVDKIFRAHFVDGLDIGATSTLARLAAAQGMEAHDTALFLASNEGTEFVHAENCMRTGWASTACPAS